jgi:hypothetical protein
MKTLAYELVNELVNRTRITPLYRGSSKVEQAVDNRRMAVRFCLSVNIYSQERRLQRVRQRRCDRLDHQRHHQHRQQDHQDRHQMQMMLAGDSVGIGVFSNVLRFERRVPGAKPGFPELWLSSKGKTGGCELPNAVSRSASHPICAFSQDSKAPVCNSGMRQCKSAIALHLFNHI